MSRLWPVLPTERRIDKDDHEMLICHWAWEKERIWVPDRVSNPWPSSDQLGALTTELQETFGVSQFYYFHKWHTSCMLLGSAISKAPSVIFFLFMLILFSFFLSFSYQNSLLPDHSAHIHTGFESHRENSCPSCMDRNTANTQKACNRIIERINYRSKSSDNLQRF